MLINHKSKIINHKFQKGFTLAETIVSIFAFAIIMLGLVALTSQIFTGANKQSQVLADTDQARKVGYGIINELRNAQTGNNGAFPLEVAQNQQIVFYSNADRDNTIERIRYYLSGGKLYRGVVEYNGSAYNTTTEVSKIVQNNVANSTSTPLFLYYDSSYVGSSTQAALSQPINLTNVKYVRLNMQILNKAGLKDINVYTLNVGGAIRNLKTNLGN
ncbi:MAG: type II secretion system protein [Candidatus Doudnabacteria bacterium]|nr:type II secretion system protein [Candidatus Doudnabacteria bacterium]